MNSNKNETKKHPEDVFDKDFEVIYEGELPELPDDLGNDDYKDVLSNLSELDTTRSLGIDYLEQNRTKTFTGLSRGKNSRRRSGTADRVLHIAALLLIAAITGFLAVTFWNHTASYANIAGAVAGHNYILGAYYGTALFLLLIEWIAFLHVLLGGNTARVHGMISFLLIYGGALLSHLFAERLPDSPVFLQGIREALCVYGGVHLALLWLCGVGVLVCVVQKYL